MKKLIVIAVLMVFAMSISVFADTTTGADWNNDLGFLNGVREHASGHDHGYIDNNTWREKRGIAAGIGLDVTVYEFDGIVQEWGADSIEVQQKYDINNNEYSGYIVCQLNAWRVIEKLMK